MSTEVLIFGVLAVVFLALVVASFFVKKKLEARSLPFLSPDGKGPEKLYDPFLIGISNKLGEFKRNGCTGKTRIYYEGTIILGIPVEIKRCYAMELADSSIRYEAPNMKYSYRYKLYGTQIMDKAEVWFMVLQPIVIWGALVSIAGLIINLML